MCTETTLTAAENRIRATVFDRLKRAKDIENETFESISKKAKTAKNHIHDIYHGKKGLTLSMAFKVWEGLGESIRDLLDEEPDPLIKGLANMTSEMREVVAELIDLVGDKEKELPPSINSLIQLIHGLHQEKFQDQPTRLPDKNQA